MCPCQPGASYNDHVPCVLQSTRFVQHIYVGPYVMYLLDWLTELLPGSQFLCGACDCTFCVIFCGLKAQSHSGDSHVHASAPCGQYVYDFAHTCPTISCILLIYQLKYRLHLYTTGKYCTLARSKWEWGDDSQLTGAVCIFLCFLPWDCQLSHVWSVYLTMSLAILSVGHMAGEGQTVVGWL